MTRWLLVAAVAAGFGAGCARTESKMDTVLVRLDKMSDDEVSGFRTAVLNAGGMEDLFVLLASADSGQRERLYAGLSSGNRQLAGQDVARIGRPDAARKTRAAEALLPLVEPKEVRFGQGLNEHQVNHYPEAVRLYAEAFALGASGRDKCYIAAGASAGNGDKEGAFKYLNMAVDSGWLAVDVTTGDQELAVLKSDPRWQQLISRMEQASARRLDVLPERLQPIDTVKLPAPTTQGRVSVEEALDRRRSERSYTSAGLSLEEAGQLLWAAYGVTKPMPGDQLRGGLKTAPSAGGLYPLELYLVAGNVTGLEPGVYRYRPENHTLLLLSRGDHRKELYEASYQQPWVLEAPASIVYSAVFARTTGKYGDRGRQRYVCMDLGHSAENVYLECAALKLGTVAIGAFLDDDLKLAVGMTREEEPLYIMPVGRLEEK